MGKKYVVIHGRVPGIYDAWTGENGCEAQVLKFEGALYKTFPTTEEANQCGEANHLLTLQKFKLEKGKAIAFVAGAFHSKKRKTAVAVSLVTDDGLDTVVKIIKLPLLYGKKNGEGELDAVVLALELATNKGIYDMLVCHNYIGTYAWATGFWSAESNGAGRYHSIMSGAMPSVHFCIDDLENNPHMRTVKRLSLSETEKEQER